MTPEQPNPSRIAEMPTPPERQLHEPEEGAIGRLLDEAKALANDLTSLIELRLKKVQIDVEERIDERVNKLSATAIFGALAALGGIFILVAVSFAIGALLGHPAWGFLIVGALLVIGGFAVRASQPHMINVGSKTAVIKADRLEPNAPQGTPVPPSGS
jgi:hypothetical protein